jgi:hypothetical protein
MGSSGTTVERDKRGEQAAVARQSTRDPVSRLPLTERRYFSLQHRPHLTIVARRDDQDGGTSSCCWIWAAATGASGGLL